MSIKQGNTDVLHSLLNIPISPIINSSSTNDECAGAKAVFDKVAELVIPLYQNGSKCVIEDILASYDENSSFDILFSGNTSGELVTLTGNKLFLIEHRGYLSNFITERAINAATGSIIAQRSKAWWGAGWSKWEKVCTTSVADVVVPTNVTTYLDTNNATASSIQYSIKNGICRIYIDNLVPVSQSYGGYLLPDNTLPKAVYGTTGYIDVSSFQSNDTILLAVENGSLKYWCIDTNVGKTFHTSFSYQVSDY